MSDQVEETSDAPAEPFVSVVFHGDRFEGAIIPVEVLPELAAYRQAIVAAAKGIFRAAHLNRERVPKGFENSIKLVLTGSVEKGSAIAEVQRVRDAEESGLISLLPPHDEADQAVDLIEKWFTALADDTSFPNDLQPSDQAQVERALASLGKYLKAGEALETRTASRPQGRKFDLAARRRLAERTGQDSIEVSYENLEGVVTAVAAPVGNQTFTLDLGELGIHNDIPYVEGDHDPLSIEAPHGRPIPVSVSLTGSMDPRSNRLKSVDEVSRLTVVDEGSLVASFEPPSRVSFAAALEELRGLSAGWDGAEAPIPSSLSIRWAESVIQEGCSQANIPMPWLYALPEGGLRAEWHVGSWRGSVVYDDVEGAVRLFSTSAESDEFRERELSPEAAELDEFVAFFGVEVGHKHD